MRSSILKHFGFWTVDQTMKEDIEVYNLCYREFPYHSSTTTEGAYAASSSRWTQRPRPERPLQRLQ